MRKIISKNPYNGNISKECPYITDEALEQKIERAHKAFQIQSKRTVQERAEIIGNMAKVFESHKREIAETITMEMGKPIAQAQFQVFLTIIFCQHYSQNYEPLLPTNVKTGAKKTLVKYNPMGIVYFMVPFNFPFILNFNGGLPNLLLGNCMLARNADSCPILGELIEKLVAEAGFNSGEYQNVYTNHQQLETILKNDKVVGVSFTGSTKSGSVVAQTAGKHIKKSVMELGGNDPFVVLADADFEKAVSDAIQGRTANCGQICFAPKRFIIAKELYDNFKSKLIEGLKEVKYGDPMNAETQIGPMAREDLHENLTKQLKEAPKGYKISWQRENIEKPFFPLTVVEGTDEVYDEQMFGPVFSLYCANNEDHAIQLANSGSYGLGASVYSQSRGQEVIDKIRCGMGFVNELVRAEPSFPTGGVAKSGYGREGGQEGYKSFANIKVHYIN